MTRFDNISKNIDCYKKVIKDGFLSTSVLNHLIIYCRYDYYRKQGYSVTQSVFFTSEDNKICESMFYKIKKEMETEL
jgi:hypothetical protein